MYGSSASYPYGSFGSSCAMSVNLILHDIVVVIFARATVTNSEGSSPRSAYVFNPMQVTVLLFAAQREAAGKHVLIEDLPDGATASDALNSICRRYPAIAQTARNVAFAVNQHHVSGDTP